MTVMDTITGLRSGEINLHEYLDRLCDKIEAEDAALQAMIPDTYSRDNVHRQASDLLARYPDPASRPPLFGVPVGVKDIFRLTGYPTRCGSTLPPSLFDGPEAPSVTRLREAGAVFMGKTVTTEFALLEPGPTRNPHNPAHTPGGSSSGSAAGVARGYFLFALGTQTIGSVIRPAGYCGVFAFVPSFGRISTEGVIPISPSADHVGFFSQDNTALDLVGAILSESPWQDPELSPDRVPTLGVPDGPYLAQTNRDALAEFEKQLVLLQNAGYRVRRINALANIEAVNHRHTKLIRGEMARTHAAWFAQYPELYRPGTADAIREGMAVSDDQLAEYRAGRAALRSELERQMAAEGIDFWVCPSAPGSAPKGLESTGSPLMNLPWTHAGLPTVSVPAGKDSLGLPLGLQAIGSFMHDEQMFAKIRYSTTSLRLSGRG